MLLDIHTFTLKRLEPTTLVKGRAATPVEQVPVELKGNIQPLKQADLQILPEAQRISGSIKIYTTQDVILYNGNESTKQNADIIEYNNIKYEIFTTMFYQGRSIKHNKYIAIRLENDRGNKR